MLTPLKPQTLPYESTKCLPLIFIPPVAFGLQSWALSVSFFDSSIRANDESRLELEADIKDERKVLKRNNDTQRHL